MVVNQFSVFWINLEPTIGSEVNKTRPCVVISPDEMNDHLRTVIIAPVTHTLKSYPSRVKCNINGDEGFIMLDQLRMVDKNRVKDYITKLNKVSAETVKSVLADMFS